MNENKDYAAIVELEKHIAQRSIDIENWKSANRMMQRTVPYNTILNGFLDEDRVLRSRLAELHGVKTQSCPSNSNIDEVLNKLLDNIDIKDFTLAIQKANSLDPTFYPSLLKATEKICNPQSVSTPPDFFKSYPPKSHVIRHNPIKSDDLNKVSNRQNVIKQVFSKHSFYNTNATPQLHPGYAASPYSHFSRNVLSQTGTIPVVYHHPTSAAQEFQKKSGAPFKDFSMG